MPMSNGRRPRRERRRFCRRVLSSRARRQGGVALILVLMVAVTASAFVILHALNTQTRRETTQSLTTVEALAQARRALIGYAVGYAGDHATSRGPGHLPCPDRAGGSDHGVAESVGADCRAADDGETGLLPFRTLGLTDLRDGSGALLWYGVAENFRSLATQALNSVSTAALSVDSSAEVVAVIIAPGAPLPGQLRHNTNVYTPAAWLEGENASPGDNRFTRLRTGAANDTVMVITRAELMAEVEKVVNKEVANALVNYRDDPDGDDDGAGVDPRDCAPNAAHCDDGLPWLVPRTAVGDAGVVGTGVAALARVPLVELDKPFNAEFVAQWQIVNAGTITASGTEPPYATCLRNNVCSQTFAFDAASAGPVINSAKFLGPVLGTPSPPWTQGVCTLSRDREPKSKPTYRLNLSCTTSYDFTASGRSLRRVYSFDFHGNTTFVAPSATTRRSVVVRVVGQWPAGTTGQVTITDLEAGKAIGSSELKFSSFGPTDSMAFLHVPFDLEVPSNDLPSDQALSPGALPRWFVTERWQQSTFVQFAPSEAPGYSGLRCPSATGCLSLHRWRPGTSAAQISSGVAGVVVSAGAPLPAQISPATPAQTRPSSDLRNYLEGFNNTEPTTDFERREPSSSFNDQILELAP